MVLDIVQLKNSSLFSGEAFIDGQWVSKDKKFDVYGWFSSLGRPISVVLRLIRAIIKHRLGQGVKLHS